MKKIRYIIFAALLLLSVGSISAQGWLDKLTNTLDAISSILGPTTSTNPNYSQATIESFSPNVDIYLESCIRTGNSVRISYTLTNTGPDLQINMFGGNSASGKSAVNDELGNDYQYSFRATVGQMGPHLGDEFFSCNLARNSTYKAAIVISDFKPNATRVALASICVKGVSGDNVDQTKLLPSLTFRNVRVYTLEELAELERQKTEIAVAESRKQAEAQAQAKFETLVKSAQSGNAASQYEVAEMYYYGTGVVENEATALEWYTKSAEQNNPSAQYMVGYYYWLGKIVPEDDAKAFEWFSKGAAQGENLCQYQVGYCYANGIVVTKDNTKAAEWYSKSAAQGNTLAQTNLGKLYLFGQGVAANSEQAGQLFTKAADKKGKEGQFYLGYMYYNGYYYKQDFAKAFDLFSKSEAQGFQSAQYYLGDAYYRGNGVAKDSGKAVEWLTKSAKSGDKNANTLLGHVYYSNRNYPLALEKYKIGVETDDSNAQYWLGIMYLNAQGVLKNPTEAKKLFTKSADNGNSLAQYQLGVMNKTAGSLTTAFSWFSKAAEQDNYDAQYELGLAYFYAKGTTKNTAKAAYWIEKSASGGNKAATNLWNSLEMWKYQK